MSIGGNLAGVSFTGLSSGIDSQSIVEQLIQLESLPLRRMQSQQAQLANRQSLYGQLKSALVRFNSSISALNTAATYNPIKASSSDSAVATLTATTSANAGTYSLSVSKLAQAHKVSSAAQTNATSALSISGSFTVNGRIVTIDTSDTLTSVASKINSASAGVTASLINGGTGNAYLTVSSSTSGASKEIQLADLSGSVLSTLGIVSGAAVFRDQQGADTVRSIGFTDGTTALATLMNGTASGAFTIGTAAINIDFATDTLDSIANKINTDPLSSATALVVTETVDGKSVSRLAITGSGGVLPTITDTNGLLQSIGVYQRAFSNEVVAAQDAAYTLDGFNFTSATNSVKDVIPGVTMTLLTANEATPKTSTLTLSKDNQKIKASMEDIVKAYNEVAEFVSTTTSFDTETFASGPLFGDSIVSQVESRMTAQLFANVGTGDIKNLAQVGFSLDKDGKLELDASKLESVIDSDPEGVRRLMMAVGEPDSVNIKFVSSTSATQNSEGALAVNVTQLATLTNMVAGTVQTTSSATNETLKFNGSLFGNTEYILNVATGSTLSSLVTLINSDTKLKSLVTASIDGSGALKVESKKYGTAGAFTLVSDLAAAADNSGLGTTGGTLTTGLDIAGTIGGFAATGNGQFLTGNEDTDVEGLQIQYLGASLGDVGSLTYQRGIAAELGYAISLFTDSVNGLITSSDKSLQTQIDDISDRMTRLQASIEAKRGILKQRFLAMEQAVSKFQGQQAQLGAMMSSRG